MRYLSEFLDSMAYGASKQTAENAQRDLEDLDKKMAQRAITPQVYEEERAKINGILSTVSGNAQKYIDSLNASKAERNSSGAEASGPNEIAPSYVPASVKSRVQLPEKDPLLDSSQGVAISDQELQNLSDKQRAFEQSKYLSEQQAVDQVAASLISAKESNAAIRAIKRSKFQTAEQYSIESADAKLKRAGFPEETINDLSPAEKVQFANGYQPPKAQAVTTDQVAASTAPSTGQQGEGSSDYVRVSNRAPNKPIRTWQDYIEAQPTAGDKYEAERQFANQHRQKSMIEILNQAQQVAPELRKDWIEQSRMMLDLKTPAMPDIRESKTFKVAETEAGKAGHLQSELTLSMMHNELSTAKVMLAEVKRLGNSSEGKTKRGQLISFLEANLPKVMQSIATGQSDAVQLSEANRLLPEVTTFFEKSPKDWAELIKLRGGFFKAFSLDVEGFMDKAELIYKAGAGAQNSIYDKAHGKLGKAVEDTGLRRFNDTINPGSRAKSDVQDIQNRLKGFNIAPVYNQNPFSESQKPVMNQTGQSPLPSSGPPLKKGRILNFGQSVKQATSFQPLLGQD